MTRIPGEEPKFHGRTCDTETSTVCTSELRTPLSSGGRVPDRPNTGTCVHHHVCLGKRNRSPVGSLTGAGGSPDKRASWHHGIQVHVGWTGWEKKKVRLGEVSCRWILSCFHYASSTHPCIYVPRFCAIAFLEGSLA